ncbi:DUF4238 domain-containing protein [Neobacillus sp. K501]
MSSVVKNQHYVPQFYLNYFANEKGNIFVYDKFNLKSFPSNSRGIASEGYFYDIKNGEMQNIEKYQNTKYEISFSNFMHSLWNKLNNHMYFKLKKYEKEEIASFLSYQYIRTKRFREESVRLFTNPDIYNSPAYFPPNIGHFFVLSDPILLENISFNLLNNYYWIIGRNLTNEPFYTSDNPFVQRESLRDLHIKHNKDFADFSLLSDEIAFPLTPKFILTFYKKNTTNKHLRHTDRKVFDVDRDNVQWFNNMQILMSYRQIYSQNNDFSFIEKIQTLHKKFGIEE